MLSDLMTDFLAEIETRKIQFPEWENYKDKLFNVIEAKVVNKEAFTNFRACSAPILLDDIRNTKDANLIIYYLAIITDPNDYETDQGYLKLYAESLLIPIIPSLLGHKDLAIFREHMGYCKITYEGDLMHNILAANIDIEFIYFLINFAT